MGVFTRLSDIINSNLNVMLEKAENPEKIVKLIIHEMEETLIEIRSRAAAAMADRRSNQREINRLQEAADDWEKKAAMAIEKKRDDLARAALVAKKRKCIQLEEARQEAVRIAEREKHATEDIETLQARLKEAKARQKSLMQRHESASYKLKVQKQVADSRLDSALRRYDRIERRIDELEASAESYSIGAGTLEDAFTDLEVSADVEEELGQLKSKLQKAK